MRRPDPGEAFADAHLGRAAVPGVHAAALRAFHGRTHQIRVHLREIGFPLAVDRVYGRRNVLRLSDIKRGYRRKPGQVEPALIDRLTLHALRIEFPDPASAPRAGQDPGRIRVESPVPRDLERALKQLAKVRPR